MSNVIFDKNCPELQEKLNDILKIYFDDSNQSTKSIKSIVLEKILDVIYTEINNNLIQEEPIISEAYFEFEPNLPINIDDSDETHSNNSDDSDDSDEQFICQTCGEQFKDYGALNDHKLVIHDKIFCDYECHICNERFYDEYQLEDHLYNTHNEQNNYDNNSYYSDDSYNENINYNIQNQNQNRINYNVPDGEFECLICHSRFRTIEHLGEHHLENHQTYEEQLLLEENLPKSFCGFVLLDMLNMITIPSTKIGNNNNCPTNNWTTNNCPICLNYITPKIISKKKHKEIIKFMDENNNHQLNKNIIEYDSGYNSGYNSDYDQTEFKLYNKNKKLQKKKSSELELDIELDLELQTKDDMYIDTNNKLTYNIPLIMSCCNNIICHTCLKNYLTNTSSVKCMFCTKDHTKRDIDYLTKISFKQTNDTWKGWWLRNYWKLYVK